jgi:hypothetical protein
MNALARELRNTPRVTPEIEHDEETNLTTNAHTYMKLIQRKMDDWTPCGVEIDAKDIHPRLFDFQRAIVQWAAAMGRAAVFAQCGLGKTNCQLEWGRLVAPDGVVLIYAPLTIAEQTIEEAAIIGTVVRYVSSSADIDGPGMYITNYERIEKFADIDIPAVILDESSAIKNFNGKNRTLLIEQYKNTPYRLCCTATPAPNDITEIANHAEFLGIKSRVEMLATYFIHDEDGWRLKGHAVKEFYRWLSSWSVYLRTPEDIGFNGAAYVLPELRLHDEVVAAEVTPEGHLFPVEVSEGIVGRAALRKATLPDRVARVVELVTGSDEQWLIWVGLNDESEALQRAIPEAVTVEGNDTVEQRVSAIRRFKSGEARVLISKPKVSGFGINFQHCHKMVFCGINDSWEQYYQAIRRCWRFGQQHPVDVHIVSSNSEARIVANVKQKEEQAKIMGEQIIANVGELNIANINKSTGREVGPGVINVSHGEKWTMWNGDCVEVLRDQVPAASVDFSVYSPPFATLFTYSDNIRDMGNNRSHDAFFSQFQFFVSEMLRVTKPGRLTCVHVQQLTTRKNTEGYIGLHDFRGRCIEMYKAAGWIHFGEVAVDKCPQAAAIRTKAHTLMFCTLKKDRSNSRPTLADFVLIFKAPGENTTPIRSDEVDNETWIKWARPIWYDIRESDTLNTRAAKSEADERHVCPLQLGLIERCIKMYSNPGEHILSPFAGIGSEGYEAIRHGRRFTGIELKPEYWQQAQLNIQRAEHVTDNELSLFTDEDLSA